MSENLHRAPSKPKFYYETPTQVKFFDFVNPTNYIGGIAYQEYIICGCCGGLVDINGLYEEASERNDLIDVPVIQLDWIDINDCIKGE